MIRRKPTFRKMCPMSYMELLFAALAAGGSASVVYLGSTATSREDLTTLDVDVATVTGMFTFVSMLVAQHPEWVI